MMRGNALLVVLLLSLAVPMPALADGVIRFSGRIVEAPCAASMPARHQVVLTGCAAAVEGSMLSVQSLDAPEGARLVELSSGRDAAAMAVSAATLAPDRRHFSSSYRIEPADGGVRGTYLVSVDYL